jgi:hypothetical protein
MFTGHVSLEDEEPEDRELPEETPGEKRETLPPILPPIASYVVIREGMEHNPVVEIAVSPEVMELLKRQGHEIAVRIVPDVNS